MNIKNFRHRCLRIDELTTRSGEAWCVFGENRSGIDTLVDLLSGKLHDWSAESIHLPDHAGVLSFRVQQEIFEDEVRNDDTDILDRIDPGTLVRQFIPRHAQHLPLLKTFGLDTCLDVGYRQLSSGQCRKLILVRALTGGATSLVLQNPYDGLDERSCNELDHIFPQLMQQGVELVLTVSATCDIPGWCSHLAVIRNGRLAGAGTREEVSPLLAETTGTSGCGHQALAESYFARAAGPDGRREELVRLRDGHAGYGGRTLFSGLDLLIRTGDHTLITGPNGCGKSTLLDMLTGDNPQCYTNDLRLFGRRRGSGESVWDIKKQMGIISPALHREHRVPGTPLQVIISGLYDTIGLYRQVPEQAIKIGRHWLAWLGLQDKADTPFRMLPFAEQRLVLIARALVKRPQLLVFDEATQGLDDVNRSRLLDLLERIASQRLSTILFVSHRKDEHLPFFCQNIRLDSYAPSAATHHDLCF